MPENFHSQIDDEQRKIADLEQKSRAFEKTHPLKNNLADKLAEHRARFMIEVDDIQTKLKDAEKTLRDKANKALLRMETHNIQFFLRDVAEKGNQLFAQESRAKERGQTKSSADKTARGDTSLAYHSIDQRAKDLQDTLKTLEQNIPFFRAVDRCKELYETKCRPAFDRIKPLREDKNITPKTKRAMLLDYADTAITELATAKKTLLVINKTTLDPAIAGIYDETLEPINENLEEAGNIKLYYLLKDYAGNNGTKETIAYTYEARPVSKKVAKLAREEILRFEEDENGFRIVYTEKFKTLPEEKKLQIIAEIQLLKKGIADEADEKCLIEPHEKKLFEGKKKLLAGDRLGAKAAILEYWETENKKPPKSRSEKRTTEAKELLKQIAKLEISQAKQRLGLLEQSIKKRMPDMANYAGLEGYKAYNKNQAAAFIASMKTVLDQADLLIESGKYATLEEAEKELRTRQFKFGEESETNSRIKQFQEGFLASADGNKAADVFDTLKQQQFLNEPDPRKRQQNILNLAKEARERGLFDLAKMYYGMYFQAETAEKSKKIRKIDLRIELENDPEKQEEIEKRLEAWMNDFQKEYKKDFKEKNGHEPTKEEISKAQTTFASQREKAKENLTDQMVNEAYDKRIELALHKDFKGQTGEKAEAWKEAYGNTFSNLETLDQRWYQVWKFSDEEWNHFKYNIFVDISILIASGGIGGGAAELLVGQRVAAVLAEKGLTIAAQEALRKGMVYYSIFLIKELGLKEAAKYGAMSLLAESGFFNLSNSLLNSVVKNDTSAFESPEAFMKAWGHNVVILGSCKAGTMGYSFKKPFTSMPGRTLDTLGSLSVETATLTGATISMMALSGEEITEEGVAKMIRDNVVITVGLKGAHHLTGTGEAKRPIEIENRETSHSRKSEEPPSGEKALHSHYESIFSNKVPESLKSEGKETKDIAGWIDTDGKIHYNSDYFERNFGVKLAQKDGKNIFIANGEEMNPKEFFKNHPKAREIRDEMRKIKNHEGTHRLLEYAENRSQNRLSKKLKNLFERNNELKKSLIDSGKSMSFKDIQEFISEVADSRIPLSAETRLTLETAIGEFLPNFSFSKVRKLDTNQLSASAPEEFSRKAPEASSQTENPPKSKLEDIQVGDFIIARSGDRRKVLEIKDGKIKFLRTEPSGKQYEEIARWDPKSANDGWVQEIIRPQHTPKKAANELSAFGKFVGNNRKLIEDGLRQGRSLEDIFYDLYYSADASLQVYRQGDGNFERTKIRYETEASEVLHKFLALSQKYKTMEVPPISPGKKSIEKGCVYFKVNGGIEHGKKTGRLYLNIRPEFLPKFYEEALTAFFRGRVRIEAKISQKGAPQDFNRYDKMVIYFNEESERSVIRIMQDLYRQNNQIFLDSAPRLTSPIVDREGNFMKGVGFGEEPAGNGNQGSFGNVRAKILSEVYRAAQRENFSLDDPQAQRVFEDSCRKYGVDPQNPAFNANPGPQSFPFLRTMSSQTALPTAPPGTPRSRIRRVDEPLQPQDSDPAARIRHLDSPTPTPDQAMQAKKEKLTTAVETLLGHDRAAAKTLIKNIEKLSPEMQARAYEVIPQLTLTADMIDVAVFINKVVKGEVYAVSPERAREFHENFKTRYRHPESPADMEFFELKDLGGEKFRISKPALDEMRAWANANGTDAEVSGYLHARQEGQFLVIDNFIPNASLYDHPTMTMSFGQKAERIAFDTTTAANQDHGPNIGIFRQGLIPFHSHPNNIKMPSVADHTGMGIAAYGVIWTRDPHVQSDPGTLTIYKPDREMGGVKGKTFETTPLSGAKPKNAREYAANRSGIKRLK